MDLGATNILPWPRDFQDGATLDTSMTSLKSGGLKGHLMPQ